MTSLIFYRKKPILILSIGRLRLIGSSMCCSPMELVCFYLGSCANGIALEKSDVDIAVSGNILSYFPYGTVKERTAVAL
jgi:hypothetical protein